MRSPAAVDEALRPLLDEIGRAVGAATDGRARAYLFGSHARGEPDADSDVDIMVILPDDAATVETEDRVRDAVYEFSLTGEHIFSVIVMSEGQARELSGIALMAEVEREGVALECVPT